MSAMVGVLGKRGKDRCTFLLLCEMDEKSVFRVPKTL
jgi:hypothetical protein